VGLADCASAGDDTAAPPSISIKATATAAAIRRPDPRFLVRDSRDEQPINAISKSSANSAETAKTPTTVGDLPPLLRERQSVLLLCGGRLPVIVVPLPQVGGTPMTNWHARGKLANSQISCCN
jgi:hypothetical protein